MGNGIPGRQNHRARSRARCRADTAPGLQQRSHRERGHGLLLRRQAHGSALPGDAVHLRAGRGGLQQLPAPATGVGRNQRRSQSARLRRKRPHLARRLRHRQRSADAASLPGDGARRLDLVEVAQDQRRLHLPTVQLRQAHHVRACVERRHALFSRADRLRGDWRGDRRDDEEVLQPGRDHHARYRRRFNRVCSRCT